MTKLSSIFGSTDNLRVKSFELGGHTFKVRVPLTKELDQINQKINSVDPQESQARFEKMVAGFSDDIEGVVKTENDVIVDGRSTRELVNTILMMENRLVEFIKLLIPTEGQNLEGLTYQDIDAEWPFSVQLEILEKISNAIQPGYKEERKN